jgi:hypothetical protein
MLNKKKTGKGYKIFLSLFVKLYVQHAATPLAGRRLFRGQERAAWQFGQLNAVNPPTPDLSVSVEVPLGLSCVGRKLPPGAAAARLDPLVVLWPDHPAFFFSSFTDPISSFP